MWRCQQPGFGLMLLGELQRQQQSSLYCDTLLQTEGVSVPAHSCVLAALSPHFSRALAASPHPPGGQSRLLRLPAVGPLALIKLVGFLYSGQMEGEGAHERDEVMAAAGRLGIARLLHGKREEEEEEEGRSGRRRSCGERAEEENGRRRQRGGWRDVGVQTEREEEVKRESREKGVQVVLEERGSDRATQTDAQTHADSETQTQPAVTSDPPTAFASGLAPVTPDNGARSTTDAPVTPPSARATQSPAAPPGSPSPPSLSPHPSAAEDPGRTPPPSPPSLTPAVAPPRPSSSPPRGSGDVWGGEGGANGAVFREGEAQQQGGEEEEEEEEEEASAGQAGGADTPPRPKPSCLEASLAAMIRARGRRRRRRRMAKIGRMTKQGRKGRRRSRDGGTEGSERARGGGGKDLGRRAQGGRGGAGASSRDLKIRLKRRKRGALWEIESVREEGGGFAQRTLQKESERPRARPRAPPSPALPRQGFGTLTLTPPSDLPTSPPPALPAPRPLPPAGQTCPSTPNPDPAGPTPPASWNPEGQRSPPPLPQAEESDEQIEKLLEDIMREMDLSILPPPDSMETPRRCDGHRHGNQPCPHPDHPAERHCGMDGGGGSPTPPPCLCVPHRAATGPGVTVATTSSGGSSGPMGERAVHSNTHPSVTPDSFLDSRFGSPPSLAHAPHCCPHCHTPFTYPHPHCYCPTHPHGSHDDDHRSVSVSVSDQTSCCAGSQSTGSRREKASSSSPPPGGANSTCGRAYDLPSTAGCDGASLGAEAPGIPPPKSTAARSTSWGDCNDSGTTDSVIRRAATADGSFAEIPGNVACRSNSQGIMTAVAAASSCTSPGKVPPASDVRLETTNSTSDVPLETTNPRIPHQNLGELKSMLDQLLWTLEDQQASLPSTAPDGGAYAAGQTQGGLCKVHGHHRPHTAREVVGDAACVGLANDANAEEPRCVSPVDPIGTRQAAASEGGCGCSSSCKHSGVVLVQPETSPWRELRVPELISPLPLGSKKATPGSGDRTPDFAAMRLWKCLSPLEPDATVGTVGLGKSPRPPRRALDYVLQPLCVAQSMHQLPLSLPSWLSILPVALQFPLSTMVLTAAPSALQGPQDPACPQPSEEPTLPAAQSGRTDDEGSGSKVTKADKDAVANDRDKHLRKIVTRRRSLESQRAEAAEDGKLLTQRDEGPPRRKSRQGVHMKRKFPGGDDDLKPRQKKAKLCGKCCKTQPVVRHPKGRFTSPGEKGRMDRRQSSSKKFKWLNANLVERPKRSPDPTIKKRGKDPAVEREKDPSERPRRPEERSGKLDKCAGSTTAPLPRVKSAHIDEVAHAKADTGHRADKPRRSKANRVSDSQPKPCQHREQMLDKAKATEGPPLKRARGRPRKIKPGLDALTPQLSKVMATEAVPSASKLASNDTCSPDRKSPKRKRRMDTLEVEEKYKPKRRREALTQAKAGARSDGNEPDVSLPPSTPRRHASQPKHTSVGDELAHRRDHQGQVQGCQSGSTAASREPLPGAQQTNSSPDEAGRPRSGRSSISPPTPFTFQKFKELLVRNHHRRRKLGIGEEEREGNGKSAAGGGGSEKEKKKAKDDTKNEHGEKDARTEEVDSAPGRRAENPAQCHNVENAGKGTGRKKTDETVEDANRRDFPEKVEGKRLEERAAGGTDILSRERNVEKNTSMERDIDRVGLLDRNLRESSERNVDPLKPTKPVKGGCNVIGPAEKDNVQTRPIESDDYLIRPIGKRTGDQTEVSGSEKDVMDVGGQAAEWEEKEREAEKGGWDTDEINVEGGGWTDCEMGGGRGGGGGSSEEEKSRGSKNTKSLHDASSGIHRDAVWEQPVTAGVTSGGVTHAHLSLTPSPTAPGNGVTAGSTGSWEEQDEEEEEVDVGSPDVVTWGAGLSVSMMTMETTEEEEEVDVTGEETD